MNNCPIGLFDSGIGGLTVFKEIRELLPNETLLYFADTARFPYGNKSADEISRFAQENATFLLSHQIKMLVIPCYTACSIAYQQLAQTLPIPVIGIGEAGVAQLAAETKTNCVAILGTTRTIESGVLQKQLLSRKPNLEIHAIACPLLASFVEEGLNEHPDLYGIVNDYLAPLKGTNVDCLLLACTHFPFLLPIFQKTMPSHIQILSPAKVCAETILDTLRHKNLLAKNECIPVHRFFSSNPYAKLNLHKIRLYESILGIGPQFQRS